MRRLRPWLLLPLAVLTAGVLSACNASNTIDPVAKAADKTTAAGSEHVEINGSVTVAGTSIAMSGSGDFDNVKRSGRLTLAMSGAGKSLQMSEVVDGWTVYLSSPAFSSMIPDGKHWLSLDLKKAGKAMGLDFDSYTNANPTQTLEQLEKAGFVTRVGSETLDGADTTHYRATIDLAKVPNGARLQALGLSYLPADVWIGSDGLVRRLRLAYSTSSGTATSTVMTMDFSNYGEPVSVQAPPAFDTYDFTDLAKSLSGSTTS